MVSENYSQARRDMAKTIGLGRKPKEAAAQAKPAPRGRRKKAEPAEAQ
jgi:predicted transcriptional regulator